MERSKSSLAAPARKGLLSRVAGAPISWGVCEVPGWGVQLEAELVLGELSALGLTATELGPPGFLPTEPDRLRALLESYGLQLVAAFVAAVLHDPVRREVELQAVRETARRLAASGGEVLVLAAATGQVGYEQGGELGAAEWRSLFEAVYEAERQASAHGVTLALHPHYGTAIESWAQVARLLDSSPVRLCLDVGHLAVGGADPLEVARRANGRVAHVHLKDVEGGLARRVRERALGYREAVREGLYTPLGKGSAHIAEIVRFLEGWGYEGWYVLEQDLVLDQRPPTGAGPSENAARSLDFLKGLEA